MALDLVRYLFIVMMKYTDTAETVEVACLTDLFIVKSVVQNQYGIARCEVKHISELNKCPYCGGESWFEKQKYAGEYEFRTNFDGTEAENGDMFDGATYKRTSKFAYCCDCYKKIAKLDSEV